jgi:hypothetical protein
MLPTGDAKSGNCPKNNVMICLNLPVRSLAKTGERGEFQSLSLLPTPHGFLEEFI